MEQGYSALTRRERLERIATAERDRRAGRIGVAIAALGDATEWPARAVLALARLPESAADETRQILEEGLDLWASEAGLAPLEAPVEAVPASSRKEPTEDSDASSFDVRDLESADSSDRELDRPIDQSELERAFEDAEAQTNEMVGANDVAERVLMQEPIGLAELDGDSLSGFEESSELETDAASAPDVGVAPSAEASGEVGRAESERGRILETLEAWLHNLQSRPARRAE